MNRSIGSISTVPSSCSTAPNRRNRQRLPLQRDPVSAAGRLPPRAMRLEWRLFWSHDSLRGGCAFSLLFFLIRFVRTGISPRTGIGVGTGIRSRTFVSANIPLLPPPLVAIGDRRPIATLGEFADCETIGLASSQSRDFPLRVIAMRYNTIDGELRRGLKHRHPNISLPSRRKWPHIAFYPVAITVREVKNLARPIATRRNRTPISDCDGGVAGVGVCCFI